MLEQAKYMKRLILCVAAVFCALTFARAAQDEPEQLEISAQTPAGKFMFSVSQYYSPVTDACTMEIGIGYLFPKAGVRVNYENVGWYDDRICHGGTVSVFVPVYKIGSFSMIPEVAAGILYGRIVSEDEVSLRTQIQAGVKLNYTISRYMSCGIAFKSMLYNGRAVPVAGWGYSLHF